MGQHFVPQAQLRPFQAPDAPGMIWVYPRGGEPRLAPIKNVAQSSGFYDEDVEGSAVAQADWEREVMRRYRGALNDGDLPIGLAITDYPDFNVYYRTVYGKGPFFLRTLREELGDAAFFAALQAYYQRHRYGIATASDVRQAFNDASGRNLDDLFRSWVGE